MLGETRLGFWQSGVRARRVRGSPRWTTDQGRPTTDNPLLSHVDHEDFLLGHLLDGVTQALAAQA
jgi:hypothetical protein